jgi:hypothetical protein
MWLQIHTDTQSAMAGKKRGETTALRRSPYTQRGTVPEPARRTNTPHYQATEQRTNTCSNPDPWANITCKARTNHAHSRSKQREDVEGRGSRCHVSEPPVKEDRSAHTNDHTVSRLQPLNLAQAHNSPFNTMKRSQHHSPVSRSCVYSTCP